MGESESKRVLVIAHVFYPEFWGELRDCIANVGPGADVIVTYVDEASVVAARRDLPQATFLLCENRGFDVWPFLFALSRVNLSDYDLVVKLHTKRDMPPEMNCRFNGRDLNGAQWRNRLLAFCRTREAWRRTLACFDSPSVGMVSVRDVIVRRRDVHRADAYRAYDAAERELAAMGGRPSVRGCGRYVAGTMFAVRSDILAFLLRREFRTEMFVPSAHIGAEDLEYAHVVERMFGLSVSACGFRIVDCEGALFVRRLTGWVRRHLNLL